MTFGIAIAIEESSFLLYSRSILLPFGANSPTNLSRDENPRLLLIIY